MPDRHDPDGFGARLLRQDEPLSEAHHAKYREKLEQALTLAERRQRRAARVVVGSCVVSLALMFVGGSGLIGDFDPLSKDANPASVAAGVIYVVATALCFITLASYYSRFRPRIGDVKERIRDLDIRDLQRQLRELHNQAGRSPPPDEPDPEPPRSG